LNNRQKTLTLFTNLAIMRLEGYEFFIDDGSTVTQVNPVIDSLKFRDEPDPDFGFPRRAIATPLLFKGDDYALILAYEQAGCQPLDFVVEYQAAEVYRGVIRLGTSKVRVDLRDCVIEAQAEPQDDYTCLVENWETERNIFTGTAKASAGSLFGTLHEETCSILGDEVILLLAAGVPTGCLPGPLSAWSLKSWIIEQDIMIPPPTNFRSTAVWVQERYTTACDGVTPVPPPGGGWQLLADNCPTDADWARPVARALIAFENTDDRYEETYRIIGGNDGLELKNGVLLSSLLDTWAPCGLDVVSDFFGIDPDGTAPANGAYAAALANLQDVLVYQKSDVRLPGSFTPASLGLWNLRGLLLSLKAQFDVEPRVSAGVLRLEHSTYWAGAPGLDLTASPYADLVAAALRYTYDDAALARRERWQFMEEATAAFAGLPIEYTGCIPETAERERVYDIGRVNNDIGFITANPDRVSDDGFVFAAAAVLGGDYYLLSETVLGTTGGGIAVNGHMAIPNLLDKYHRSGRMLLDGLLNGAAVTFDSAVARRVQDEFAVLLSRATYHASFDAADLVDTVLGSGEVVSAEYDAADRSLTLNLKYA
jgi:hypothetical protein